ncbi:peptidyl-prolyl cis-trans isomerase sig-7 [Chironomus tepperi]|uniref:peptidyl-prolyl cis-trans isomerase sig-7 n=1 Tax=Chironomus tepperi TaxID=113505 RepID=UPI00391F99F4
MSVVIETTVGDITVDLYVKERPKACLNFIKLCKLKYYNYNLFHTIERNFLAQTGDITGEGTFSESIWGVINGPQKRFFEAEQIPKILHSDVGLLSMVAFEDGYIGSQFFFTLGTELSSLDGIHCVIGEVVEGIEVLRILNEAITDEKHRPYKDIRITHTVILDDPFPDMRGFREPSRSPSPTPERLKNGRIGADEEIDDTEGKTEAEIQEMLESREAKTRATILEIVGDLPDAECAPPENVLFVCKLNPVTTDDDLEIIFSRFGKIKSCEVIRDKQTGDSLQYAFIEFEEQKSCENAYFKMDNVLIDDRRIHVDFSQSVSKIKWRGKGNYTIYGEDEKESKSNYNDRKERRSRSPQRRYDNRDRYDNRPKPYNNYRNNNNRYDNSRRFNDNRSRNYRPDNRRDYRDQDRVRERSRERYDNYRRPEKRRNSRERSRDRSDYRSRDSRRSRDRSNERKRDKSDYSSSRRKEDDRSRHKSSSHKNSKRSSSSSDSDDSRRKKSSKDKKKSSKRRSSSSSESDHRSKKSRK